MSYKLLGDYIQPVNNRNRPLVTNDLRGLSMRKEFRKSTSNIVGVDLTKYKLIAKNQFACDFMSVIRVHKLPVVLHTEDEPVIVSPAYTVFEVLDEEILNPEYLMMWFRRSEFDRYADFRCDSAVRGGFMWEELCDTQLPIPSIEKQQQIVAEYNTVTNRIHLNNQLNQKLEATAQALYKHWFVDFEFPNDIGKPYKSNDGKMVFNEELEKDIPVGWSVENLGSIINYTKGYAFKSVDYIENGFPVVRVSDLTKKSINFNNCYFINDLLAEESKKVEIKKNDIIITSVGSWASNPDSVVGKVIKAPSINTKCYLNQNMVKIKCKNEDAQIILYNSISTKEFSDYTISGAQGSANQASVTLKHLFNYHLCFPEEKLLKSLSLHFNSINNLQLDSQSTNIQLQELQSLLLAKMTQQETKLQNV
jgi:type I restriction enzyme S subunit